MMQPSAGDSRGCIIKSVRLFSGPMKTPEHLNGKSPQGEIVGEPIAQYEIGTYKNFVYLVIDWDHRKALIVDPQKDLSRPLSSLKKYELELVGVLLTHTHFDHIAGVPQLIKDFPEIPIFVPSGETFRMEGTMKNTDRLKKIKDGDCISVGKLSLEVIHTPGHSKGECCYYLPGDPPYLLTGDTIFIRDCGRTDAETGSNEEMFASIQKIKTFPSKTVVLPGHHYHPNCSSDLATEMKESPPFLCKSVADLANLP